MNPDSDHRPSADWTRGWERHYSSRVTEYAAFRPGYPAALLDLLRAERRLTPAAVVADVGSGTGLLSEPFLVHGHRVYGVEPNAGMRAAAEARLAAYPGFTSVAAAAEDTTLGAASVDLVTVGRALHWFDYDRALREFRRMLKDGGSIAIVWLKRRTDCAFGANYDALLERHAPRHRARLTRQARLEDRLMRDGFVRRSIAGEWTFDREALRGMTLSFSIAPDARDPAAGPMLRDVDDLFARHAERGHVSMPYDTVAYLCSVDCGEPRAGSAPALAS